MMDDVTPEEWRDQVGRQIEQRRNELRLSARAAASKSGFSEGQWRQMESGRRTLAAGQFVTVNPRPATRAAACVVLGWTDDSIDRLVRGERPLERAAPGDVSGAPSSARLRSIDAELRQLRSLVDDVVGVVRELADAGGVAVPASMSRETLAMAAEGAEGAPPPARVGNTSGPRPDPEDADPAVG